VVEKAGKRLVLAFRTTIGVRQSYIMAESCFYNHLGPFSLVLSGREAGMPTIPGNDVGRKRVGVFIIMIIFKGESRA
jgi:hypothetical protein